MPYDLSTKTEGGKKKWCMTNKDTGKTYCYDSNEARNKGMRMHEAFKHGWKPTGKAKRSSKVKRSSSGKAIIG